MTDKTPDNIPVDASPSERIAFAVDRFGEHEVIARSIALLGGQNAGEEFLLYVGGTHAQGILDGAPALYWPEVWGARAFNYIWSDTAIPAVTAGLANQAWRVREMCTRVAALRHLDVAAELSPLLEDEVARVRAGAARALSEVGTPADALSITALFRDPEVEVRKAAGVANKRLRARFPDAPAEAPAK